MKYLHPFKFYVAHTFCKRVVCIRLNAFLSHNGIAPFNSDLFLQGIHRINLTVELAFGVMWEVFVLDGLYFSLMVSYKTTSGTNVLHQKYLHTGY